MLRKIIVFLTLIVCSNAVFSQGTQSKGCMNAGAEMLVVFPVASILIFVTIFLMKSSRDEFGALMPPSLSKMVLYFLISVLISVPIGAIALELMC